MHDVINVFMCTGFTRDTGQYFMKASPVRPGDSWTCLAEVPLLGALSACPGGDCSAEHTSDAAACYPLRVEVLDAGDMPGWAPPARNVAMSRYSWRRETPISVASRPAVTGAGRRRKASMRRKRRSVRAMLTASVSRCRLKQGIPE